jgi:hypothetical protein
MKSVDKFTVMFGIGCISALEVIAMLKGFDGLILTTVIGVIALAIGITIPTPGFIRKE